MGCNSTVIEVMYNKYIDYGAAIFVTLNGFYNKVVCYVNAK